MGGKGSVLMAAGPCAAMLLLSGCASDWLEGQAFRYRAFAGIRRACTYNEELGVVYTETGGGRPRERLMWFSFENLRKAAATPETSKWAITPEEFFQSDRKEQPPSAIPKDAVPVPAIRLRFEGDTPSLPSGARIAVCWRITQEGYRPPRLTFRAWVAAWPWLLGYTPSAEAVAVLAREDGTVLKQGIQLPLSDYYAWWYYPLVPAAAAADLVTLPFQAVWFALFYEPPQFFSQH